MLKSQSGGALLIIVFILVVVLVGGGAYYLGTKNSPPAPQSTNSDLKMSGTETSLPPTQPIGTQTNPIAAADPYSDIPAGWSFEKGTRCDTRLPIPPKQPPYYIEADKTANYGKDAGGWWHLLDQPFSNSGDKFFTNEEIIIFDQAEPGTSYAAGLVQVICGPNTKNYNTQTFVEAYSEQFTDGTFDGLTFEKIGEMPMWGRSVAIALIRGGMYENETEYFFATPTQLFRVRRISMSTNKFINDTTDLILKNLQFPD